jgi:uncharacterized protein YkwD
MPTRLPLLLLATLLLAACGAGAPVVAPAGGAGSLSTMSDGEQGWAREVFELTNLEREARGIPPLHWDDRAAEAAYEHCWDMHLRDFFHHVNPDGQDPGDRLAEVGVEFRYAGENIARGQLTPREVVRAWMESPGHRENMLSPAWTHVGVGVHSGAERGPWWAQEFYRP